MKAIVPAFLLTAAIAGAGAYGWHRYEVRARRQAEASQAQSGLRLVAVVIGLHDPLYLTAPASDPRLFIVEQDGRIRVVRDGQLLPRPYLDITARVGGGGERGLLSVAFHPQFRENGRFYVDYTDHQGDIHIARFSADPAADTANTGSEQSVLQISHPRYANHNGGHVLFGPDGRLYVGMGDGGSGGDPNGNAQNPDALLGKLLRLDVDAAEPYAVPEDNPFARGGGRGEIWATGLRNPWRFAFDSGLVYIADVGQNAWEEVDVAHAGVSGLNYGWRTMEGAHCYRMPFCSEDGLVQPALEYSHDDGCSVIGGVVYRGQLAPVLIGRYLYSDYCAGFLRSFHYVNGVATEQRMWRVADIGPVLSFGQDASGEVYVMAASGTVYRIEAEHR